MKECENCGKPRCRGRFCMAPPCRAALQRARRRELGPDREPTPCENCGEPTTVAGPASEHRFCMKPDCRKARARYDYNLKVSDRRTTKVEDRPCSACGARLPKRPWRVTDSSLGRWCRKAKCQEARGRVERGHESARRYWQEEMPAIECPACGLDVGVRRGYVHPHRDHIIEGKFVSCTAVGEQIPDEDLVEFAKADWNKARAAMKVAAAAGPV